MPELLRPGDYCPNNECADYGKVQSDSPANIIKFGKTKAGHQRYRCKTCKHTFVETTGTLFYRRRTPADEIIDTLSLIGEGSRISSLARAKGHKEDTIVAWVRAAGEHAEQLEEILLAEHQIERGQLDGLWAYIQNKGEKKTTPKPPKADNSGVRP